MPGALLMCLFYLYYFGFQVLSAILQHLPSIEVKSFVVDYEAGLWQAIRDVFPQPDIQGCAFHFGQALYRKVQ
ncbi:hypothetical protein DPMN_033056 [Dreissena polymorpha]|uniref:MULE transposase domain-containing protein n=1 Tax=Dreissena polymorpha TaxID=45954 RepID=A0A9D4M592_DREPO|nr:hypothetical protein DPMN_033056 [Dreissena polymorpha]